MTACEFCGDVTELFPFQGQVGIFELCAECIRAEEKPTKQHEEEDE